MMGTKITTLDISLNTQNFSPVRLSTQDVPYHLNIFYTEFNSPVCVCVCVCMHIMYYACIYSRPICMHVDKNSGCMVMKSIIFWDMPPCSPLSFNRRFGGTYRLHLQGRRNRFSKPASKQVRSWYLGCIASEDMMNDGSERILKEAVVV
jgi:hypothetical protein